jgi:hypothetical protein
LEIWCWVADSHNPVFEDPPQSPIGHKREIVSRTAVQCASRYTKTS